MSENKLSLESSLYLKQHAENPVHWWPYNEQALKTARELNKLIFVSIGYSSCHWCHVMAHESFEDETTAKYLNEHFVSIKVDREEFPDVDNYFQNACSIMTGRGGWPLTVFLTPDGKPFFAGTYFPKEGRQGLPSFMEILKHISDLYKNTPDQLKESAENLVKQINSPNKLEKKIQFQGHFPPPSAIMNALKNFADSKNGGYGEPPKFPHFPFYEWAAEQILEGMIPQELGKHIAESVERMLMGGMYDHVRGGIHRYSTDAQFMVPHFEKMLYDQAGLLKVLARVSQFYPAPIIYDGILQTIDYLRTEMVDDTGYFFSAQDADSEGMEGLYFTFSKEEFVESFNEAPEAQRAKLDYYLKVFQITDKGNFTHGLNVISLNPEMKSEYYMQDGWQEVREIRRRLLELRKYRMPPATDRKGLASWNFMLISALIDVVQYCQIDVIQNEAFSLVQPTIDGCLKTFLVERDGRHLIRHSTTLQNQPIYLEDYVNFADSQLRLYEITGNQIFKNNAIESVDFTLKQFMVNGEFFQTAMASGPFERQRAPLYDQSYRSPVMTLSILLSRLSVFRPDFHPEVVFGEKFQDMVQFTLTSPLGHGEGLKAFTYPQDIYRKIEVPMEWNEMAEFQGMRTHFFSRFVMDYHNRKDDTYQICTREVCEAQGTGFEQFKTIFKVREEKDA